MASLSLAFDILAKDRASKVFNDVGDAADNAGKKSGKFAGALGAAKGGVAAAAGIAGAALAAFGVSSISAASDLEQSSGAIESVFGRATEQVRTFAETSAERLGLAKSEYQALASVVGSQLQRLGQSQDESAKSTDKLLTLSADLAATFGGPVSDAVEAVGSLLRGERDPIERYAVGIKDVDVMARLAATGQDKLKGASLEQAKAQATLALLFDQTKNAQGAFGRESNTLAGTQERLRAQFKNVQAEVGTALLPVLTTLGQKVLGLIDGFKKGTGAGGDLRAAFDKLKQAFIDNRPQIEAVGKALLAVGVFIATEVLPRLVQLYSVELKAVVGAFKLLITVAAEVSKAFLSMISGFLSGLQSVFSVLARVPGPFKDNFQQASEAVGRAKAQVDGLKIAIDVASRPKTAKISADTDRAESDVSSLGRQIRNLQDKTVTVTTIQRTVYEAQRDGKGGGIQARALGGPITAGSPYLVGERGPELIIPSQSGNVLTAGQTQQALAGATYNITTTATDPAQLVGLLRRMEALNA